MNTAPANSPDVKEEWAAAIAATERERSTGATTRHRGRAVVRGGALGLCMAGGLAGSVAVQASLRHPAPPEEPATTRPMPSEDIAHTPHHEADIEALIRAGCFREALKLCHSTDAPDQDPHSLAYHEALCLEGLGQWRKAAEAYRRATDPHSDVAAWAWAMFGQVRCALAAGENDTGGELLAQVIQRVGLRAGEDVRILGECLHLRARFSLMELGPQAVLDPFDADALAWPSLTADLERYLDWLEQAEDSHDHGFAAPLTNKALLLELSAKHVPRGDVAARVFRLALLAAPDHPTARAAQVTLANLDFQAGRLAEANQGYRRVLDTAPNSSEAVYAAYNLGLLELRQWNLHAAQARFLEVVDRGPGTRWADYGWWWIGRSHLDAGDTALALRPLETALAGKTKEVSSAAALGLCACHLLDGDNESARITIRTHRVSTRETHSAMVELFEALLRFRAAPGENRGETLLAAVHTAHEARALGTAGTLLVGRAYRELGLHDSMVHLYDQVSAATRGSLAVRMTFEVAERFDKLDLRHEARQRYLTVAVMDPRGLGPTAELRVADLAARDGRGSECVHRCRELIDRPGIELGELLHVMGRGYELQKKYRLAAECFAGRIPAE